MCCSIAWQCLLIAVGVDTCGQLELNARTFGVYTDFNYWKAKLSSFKLVLYIVLCSVTRPIVLHQLYLCPCTLRFKFEALYVTSRAHFDLTDRNLTMAILTDQKVVKDLTTAYDRRGDTEQGVMSLKQSIIIVPATTDHKHHPKRI